MRWFLLVLSLSFFISCATYPKVQTLNSLKPGISKTELKTHFSNQEPISTEFIDGYYLLKYKLQDRYDIEYHIPYYFLFDQNNHLIGWEKVKGQEKISAGGVSILIPFPSRK